MYLPRLLAPSRPENTCDKLFRIGLVSQIDISPITVSIIERWLQFIIAPNVMIGIEYDVGLTVFEVAAFLNEHLNHDTTICLQRSFLGRRLNPIRFAKQ